jgi:phosphoglucosamine mutase
MAICATHLLQEKKLAHNTLVATVMSNIGLDIAMKKTGGKVVKTAVGDRYVAEEMLRHGYNLGGEQSGHMIFLDHNTTGDGMISALQVLAIMQRTGKTLAELAEVMSALPQVLLNVRVEQRRDISEVPEVQKVITAAEKKLGDSGRVLIRYSGTEPLLRIMLEGQDKYQITELAHNIGAAIEKYLGGKKEER